MKTRRQRVRETLRITISLVTAAVLLYFSFREVQWDEFVGALGSCRWGYVLAAMLAGVVAPLFRGLRWRRTILPFDQGVDGLSCFDGIAIGNMTNLAIPYSGEVVRCTVVKRNSRTGQSRFSTLLGTAALERVCDLLTIGLLFALLLVLKWSSFGGFFVEKIARPLMERFGSWSIWAAGGAVLAVSALALWWVLAKRNVNAVAGKLAGLGKTLFDGFVSVTKMDAQSLWRFILYTVLIWVMYWLQIVLVARALPFAVGLTIADALFISLVGSIAALIPAPGGFGAYHYLVAGVLFSLYGLEWGSGLVFATISHESQVVTFILTGLLSLLVELVRGRRQES